MSAKNGAFGKPPLVATFQGLGFYTADIAGSGASYTGSTALQTFHDAVCSGAIPAGSILRVSPRLPAQGLNVGGAAGAETVPLGGMSIICDVYAGPGSPGPTITALVFNSTGGKIQNIYIKGFVIQDLDLTGTSGGNITYNKFENCLFSNTSASADTTITFDGTNGGVQYITFTDCWGNDLQAGAATPSPFIDVKGGTSSMGHFVFNNFQHLVANGAGGGTTIFAQVETACAFGPDALYFSGLRYVTLYTTHNTLFNYIGDGGTGATVTQCSNRIVGGYIEGHPVTLVAIAAFSGTSPSNSTLSAMVSLTGLELNCTSVTLVSNSNAQWTSKDNGVVVQGGTTVGSEDTDVLQGTWTVATVGKAFVRLNLTNGPRGYNATQISVPATTVAMVNTNPYPVMYEVEAAGTVTVAKFTDTAGGTGTETAALFIGEVFGPVGSFESVTFTYTVAPTIKTRGL